MWRGLERPPWWAVVVMVLGIVWLGVGGAIAANRPEPPRFTAPASAADPVAQPTHILIIGDSYTGGSDMGGNGGAGWPRLVAADLTAAGYAIELTASAAGGSGYVEAGPTGKTLVDLAKDAAGAEPFDLVIFFGSRNDTAGRSEVQAAASEAFTAVKTVSPNAALLVIGPPWINSRPPSNITADRDGVEAAAQAAGATFVDPLREDWFGGQYQSLISSDGVHPTDEGHRHMADLITPRVEQALDQMGASRVAASS